VEEIKPNQAVTLHLIHCIYLKVGGKKFVQSTDIEIRMDVLIAFHYNQ
jgi:hypothetical protein